MIYRDSLLRLKFLAPGNGVVSQVWGRDEIVDPEKIGIYYTGYAREAIAKGLELFGIGKGCNVLLPAYICKTAVEPFNAKGIKTRFYNVGKDFTADMAELNRLVDEKTKALLYVNYFGLLDNFDYYQNFCRSNGLCIIGDYAHCLIRDYRQAKADLTIFSLRKFYPTLNGAVLIVKKDGDAVKSQDIVEYVEKNFHPVDYKLVMGAFFRRAYSCVSNAGINRVLLNFKKTNSRSMIKEKMGRDTLLHKRVIASSFRIINNIDFDFMFFRRRANYAFLLERLLSLESRHVKTLFNRLDADMCPLALPVLVEKYAESFIEDLFINGYAVYPWPDLPQQIVANSTSYKNEIFLSRSVILLPIHQGIAEDHLERMVLVIKKWASKVDRIN